MIQIRKIHFEDIEVGYETKILTICMFRCDQSRYKLKVFRYITFLMTLYTIMNSQTCNWFIESQRFVNHFSIIFETSVSDYFGVSVSDTSTLSSVVKDMSN